MQPFGFHSPCAELTLWFSSNALRAKGVFTPNSHSLAVRADSTWPHREGPVSAVC